MEVSYEAFGILAILLPGFLSSTILDGVVVRKPKEPLPRIIEALVFSFLIYAILVVIMGVPAFEVPATSEDLSEAVELPTNRAFVLGALLLSVALPLGLGFLSTTDLHMRFLRWCRISNKTARETTWLDVFSDQRRYVIVNLSGERRVFGWPLYYSNDRDEGLLYLFNPSWVNEDGTYTPLNIHGLFLVEADSIETIEFTDVTYQSADVLTEPEEEES